MLNRTITINTISRLALIAVPLLFFSGCRKEQKRDKQFELKIIKVGSGYGYQIYNNNKIIINQPNIPAIEYEKPFSDSTQAKKTGELAMRKLRRYKLPSISKSELDSMNIDTKN